MTTDPRQRLNDFDPTERQRALDDLLAAHRAGGAPWAPSSRGVNLHCHTVFSYNGYGHSPTSLAWLAAEQGWRMLATVDFDVLDGVEETLAACDRVGVRGAAGIETRTYLPEFSAYETNSPGEPGVFYHIGVGFTSSQPAPQAAQTLDAMRRRAAERNRDMVARINAHLAPATVDYDRDVLPLTPAGNATERHILIAYDAAARRAFPDRADLLTFWAAKLGMSAEAVGQFMGDAPFPHDQIRSKLMKRGGVGYVQPGPDTFPPFDEVNRAILACGAVPVLGWLDGTSAGEQRMEELLALLIPKGVAAVNIIPDRNWNLSNAEERTLKVREMYRIVELARANDLPILAGTELNKAGQRLIDDFDAEPMRPLLGDFVSGADWLYGHTVMQRALGAGASSAWAARHLPARRERNAFYVAVGQAAAPGAEVIARLAALGGEASPEQVLARLG